MQFSTTSREDLGHDKCSGYREGTLAVAVAREVSNGLKEELGL